MIINLKEEFLAKSFENGVIAAGRDLYDLYRNDTTNFHKAAQLYQDIISRYNPKDAVKLIYLKDDVNSLNSQSIEDEYLYAVYIVARYQYQQGNAQSAYLWAKKGLGLFDIFNKQATVNMKSSIKERSDFYFAMEKIFDDSKQKSDQNLALEFDWEKNYFSVILHHSITYANC